MPSPNNNSTFIVLIRKLLRSLDQFNSTDLTLADTNNPNRDTSGVRAGLCINRALQKIYDLIKDSKYMDSFPTTSLSTTIDQDFIDLDEETTLDDIEAITDTANDYRLTRRSWSWYKSHFPDPSQSSGIPQYYIRRDTRIYLAPRPNGVINYTVDFRKFTGDLKVHDDLCILPTRYDYWIIDEALVNWYSMEDPSSVPELIILERNNSRQTALESIFTSYDRILQAGSNTEGDSLGIFPYSRPVGGT